MPNSKNTKLAWTDKIKFVQVEKSSYFCNWL